MHALPVNLPGLRRPITTLTTDSQPPPIHSLNQPSTSANPLARVSNLEASRLLAACALHETYFDLVDVDSFGADGALVPRALQAAAFGGLVYLTATSGTVAAGLLPEKALAEYGCYARAHPSAMEQGLRMLLGAAVSQGALQVLLCETPTQVVCWWVSCSTAHGLMMMRHSIYT